jgi:hypothetical protein
MAEPFIFHHHLHDQGGQARRLQALPPGACGVRRARAFPIRLDAKLALRDARTDRHGQNGVAVLPGEPTARHSTGESGARSGALPRRWLAHARVDDQVVDVEVRVRAVRGEADGDLAPAEARTRALGLEHDVRAQLPRLAGVQAGGELDRLNRETWPWCGRCSIERLTRSGLTGWKASPKWSRRLPMPSCEPSGSREKLTFC